MIVKFSCNCFWINLQSDYKESLMRFRKSYSALGISGTPKIHAIWFHVHEFCEKRQQGMGSYSNRLGNPFLMNSMKYGKNIKSSLNIQITTTGCWEQCASSIATICKALNGKLFKWKSKTTLPFSGPPKFPTSNKFHSITLDNIRVHRNELANNKFS